MQKIAIHWFRQDLRLSDNPALTEAAKHGQVLPIYILDDETAGNHAMGGASRWWLHHSLLSLNASLEGKLSIYQGNAEKILPQLAKRLNITAVYWNRCYEPWRLEQDKKIEDALSKRKIETHTSNASLLWEPWDVKKKDGTPYKVFTQFYRKGCLNAAPPRTPMLKINKISLMHDGQSSRVEDLKLLPQIRWDKQLEPHWHIGEAAAQKQLKIFLDHGIKYYKEGRNFPAKPYVSRLSPHLHFGEISPNQAWHAVKTLEDNPNIDTFCSELGWREFSHSLLHYSPTLPQKNLQPKFDALAWRSDKEALWRWQQGQTGYPIIDAGMRELWQTGYMHNRVRMIVGSFLVKNLLLDWRQGERWFWDCLVDADLANNSASWQWVAGCGADAAPYFRIFNPITQGEKFDPDGEYTRRFIPELSKLPNKYLFSPWKTPPDILEKAGIKMGKDYPMPIVDIAASRERALQAFKQLSR